MDVQPVSQKDSDALRRIAALLVALAVLAERAGSRSNPVCCLVLWILRPAEVIAREFVADAAQEPLPVILEIPATRSGASCADAVCLALSFRALAAALENLPRQALCFAPRFGRLFDERPSLPGVKQRVRDLRRAEADLLALHAREKLRNDTS